MRGPVRIPAAAVCIFKFKYGRENLLRVRLVGFMDYIKPNKLVLFTMTKEHKTDTNHVIEAIYWLLINVQDMPIFLEHCTLSLISAGKRTKTGIFEKSRGLVRLGLRIVFRIGVICSDCRFTRVYRVEQNVVFRRLLPSLIVASGDKTSAARCLKPAR